MKILIIMLLINSASAATFIPLKTKKSYQTYSLETVIEDEFPNNIVQATIYKPIRQKIKAILLLTPTIAGVSAIESSTAKYFSNDGYLVIIPLPYPSVISSDRPDVKILDKEFFKPGLAANQFLVDVGNEFNLSNTLPVFAMGASQGGFRTLSIAASSNRITASWFVTTGGDFASIYARSTVEAIAVFRKKQMKYLGFEDIDLYEEYLRKNLKNDPLFSCSKINSPFVQVIALRDNKVPTANQELLASACPTHKVIRLNVGHVSGSLSIVFLRDKIKNFFESMR